MTRLSKPVVQVYYYNRILPKCTCVTGGLLSPTEGGLAAVEKLLFFHLSKAQNCAVICESTTSMHYSNKYVVQWPDTTTKRPPSITLGKSWWRTVTKTSAVSKHMMRWPNTATVSHQWHKIPMKVCCPNLCGFSLYMLSERKTPLANIYAEVVIVLWTTQGYKAKPC